MIKYILFIGLLSFDAYAIDPTLLNFLGEISQHCSIQITSSKRTAAHNKKVGGTPKSKHLTDEAVDFVFTNHKKRRGCRLFAKTLASEFNISILYHRKHLHIDTRPYRCFIRSGKVWIPCS